MSNDQQNFLGIPIEGDITRGERRTPQRPFEELQTEMAKLIGFDSFTSLKWEQYTPYFNDGDPCVFRVYPRGIEVPDESAGDYEDGYYALHEAYGYDHLSEEAQEFVGKYTRGAFDWTTRERAEGEWVIEPKHPKMIRQALKVLEMLESGAYDDGLFELFGDHAEVALRSDKVTVDFVEHD